MNKSMHSVTCYSGCEELRSRSYCKPLHMIMFSKSTATWGIRNLSTIDGLDIGERVEKGIENVPKSGW